MSWVSVRTKVWLHTILNELSLFFFFCDAAPQSEEPTFFGPVSIVLARKFFLLCYPMIYFCHRALRLTNFIYRLMRSKAKSMLLKQLREASKYVTLDILQHNDNQYYLEMTQTRNVAQENRIKPQKTILTSTTNSCLRNKLRSITEESAVSSTTSAVNIGSVRAELQNKEP